MDQPWWGSIVQWGAWGVLMALVMGWMGRSRLRPRPRSTPDELGLPAFAQVLLAHAPPAAIAPETRAILEATAAGDPPSVWA